MLVIVLATDGSTQMKRSPNIAFFGGTVIIAIMVMAAFANLANA